MANGQKRSELAADRTDLAEDRTLLANERTFAGWMRTGLAAVGIGLGFNALFRELEPVWVPKTLATIFVVIGIFIFWAADKRACQVQSRLNAHKVETAGNRSMRVIAVGMSAAAAGLVAGFWILV